jgi:hypothetical protein
MRAFALALALALAPGCGTSAVEAPPEPAPRPDGVPVALPVLSAGVEGEYPIAQDADAPNLTLHLVDGDPATAWRPVGVARIEVGAAELSAIELVHTGVQALRWRPLHAEGEALVPGAWSDVDLTQVATVGEGPWQRFTARPERAVRGIELEAPSPSDAASIGELRLTGAPAAPEAGVRSTRWVAVTSSTADGPFQRAADQVEAVDPARCMVWIDGVEHRGTEQTCRDEGERVSIGIEPDGGGEPTTHELTVRALSGCFGLIDGRPYTRCAPTLTP